MTPERWRQVSDVFHAALGHDQGARRTYLDRACADDGGLRAEVDALLAAHDRAGSFGEAPIFASEARRPPPDDPGANMAGAAPARSTSRGRFVWLVWVMALATVAAFSTATWRFMEQGFALKSVGWSETRHGEQTFVTAVDAAGPAAGRVRSGDRIVALNGLRPINAMGTRYQRSELAPGDTYELTVMRAGELETQRLPVVASRAGLATRVGWFVVALVWCAVGLFVGFARPDQPLARLAFASAVATGLVVFQIGVARGGLLWQPLHVVLWYHFFARFPTGAALRGGWKAVLLVLYGAGSVVAGLGFAHHAVFLFSGAAGAIAIVDRLRPVYSVGAGVFSLLVWLTAIVATFFVVRRNYSALVDRDQRRRVRWVAYGAGVAVLPMFAALLLVTLPPQSSVGVAFDSELVVYAFSLGIPVSVAYAIVKHRVFDIRVVIRHGVQYLFARRALQLLVALPVVAWVYTLAVNRDSTLAELVTQSTGHVYWIVAAALALRFRKPIQLWLDRRFFREEFDREQMLIGLVDDLGKAESISDLSERVCTKLEPALHPAGVFIWYRDPGEHAAASASNPHLSPPDFPGGRWLAWLDEQGSGVNMPLPAEAGLSPRESEWLAQRDVALAVPIRDGADRLVGVLLLGGKKSEEPYTSGDVRFLNAIARQLAVNRDNLRLRTRLSEEVRVRRDVLARLDDKLPDLLKECPACRACFSGAVETCDVDGTALVLSLPIARTVDGRYRLDRLLGKGGMGAVYAACDLRLEREVAVKLMLSRAFGQPGALRRFRREARTAAGLSHPNIVTVYDVGSVEGEGAYIVMERVRGETLRAALAREHRLSHAVAAQWFEPLLDGIAAAHAAGIVHRDLKPDNVMGHRDDAGTLAVKILDLGLVKLRTVDADAPTTVTQEGTVMGTPDYMPPEQLLGRDVDHRADLFAIGVMLLEALTGGKTLDGAGPPQGAGQRTPLPAVLSAELDDLLRNCLAADSRDRPASAAVLKQRLMPLLQRGLPPTAGRRDS